MDVMMILKATLLGLVCGITEFLPVSSNGHVIILDALLGFEGPPGKLFEISLQLGAILAVCWLFRAKLIHTVTCIAGHRTDQLFAFNIFIAFLPAAILGALFHKFLIAHFFNAPTVALMLLLGGIAILIIEKVKPAATVPALDDITPKRALLIGLFQTLALIPGVSRSGATIMGAMLLGVERRAATEFSFFLAIPMILAASFYDLFIHRGELTAQGFTQLAIGFVVSFFSALIVVKWLLRFISLHTFKSFAIYRIIMGTAVLAFIYWVK